MSAARFRLRLLGCLPVLLASMVAIAASAEPAAGNAMPVIEVRDRPLTQDRLQALKLPLARHLLPFSTEVIDRDMIEAAGRRSIGEVIDQVGGAISVGSEGGSTNNVLLRGFEDTPFFRNGLNDSLGQLAPRSTANVERVEILKGPSGALFGPGEPGGAINLVTLQPQRERAATLRGGYDGFGRVDLVADVTGAVPGKTDWQYRLVGERASGDTFRQRVDDDRWFVAPSLAWQPGPHSRITLSAEYLRDERLLDAGTFISDALGSPSRRRFLGEPGVGDAVNEARTLQVDAVTATTRGWTVEFQFQAQRTRLEGIAVEPAEIEDTQLLREAQRRNEVAGSWIAQFEVNGALHALGWRHDALFGLQATGVHEDVLLTASDTDDDPFALDLARPVFGAALPMLERERDSGEHRRQYSMYARDLVTLGPRWRLLLAARFDHVTQTGRDAVAAQAFGSIARRVSPRAALVWDSGVGITAWSGYSESLDPNEGLQPNGSALQPTRGRAVEGGLRWTDPDKQWRADATLFGIRQTNVTVDAPGNPGFELQTARQENVGASLELAWTPSPDLALSARYQWVDARITGDPVIPNGTEPLNVPRHQAGLQTTWQTSVRRAGDFDLGLAINYVGRRAASLEPEELDLRLADYVRIDLFARWRINRRLELKLNVDNLLDENFIQGSQSDAFSLSPGTPLQARGELVLRF